MDKSSSLFMLIYLFNIHQTATNTLCSFRLFIVVDLDAQQFIISQNQGIRMQEQLPLLQKPHTYKSKLKITLIVLNLALSSFYFGYCIVYFGQIDIDTIRNIYDFPEVIKDIGDDKAKGLLNGCTPVGAFVGALITSFFINRVSRRNFLLGFNVIALIVGGLIYITNFYALLILRILQGVCVGAYSAIIPLLIRELAPTQISGTLGSYAQLLTASGLFFACIFKYILSKIFGDDREVEYWPYIYAVPEFAVLVQTIVLLLVFPYETPSYLLSVGKEQEAKKLIELIYKEQYVDQIFKQKTADMIVCGIPRNLPKNIIFEQHLEKKYSNKIPFYVALHLTVLQQFSGISAVAIYAGDIANKFITSIDSYGLLPSLINLVPVITTFAAGYALAKIGRKSIIQFGTLFLGIGNLLVAIGFLIREIQTQNSMNDTYQILIMVGLFVFMGVFGLSLGPLVWLYIPEIVQDKKVPFTTAANWFSASIVIILVPIFIDKINCPLIFFLIFAAWCFIAYFFNRKYVIESKDKTFRDIQQQYSALKPLKFC